MELTMPKKIGEKEIAEAASILEEYKAGKASLERRVIDDELWWKLRHWEAIRREDDLSPKASSAWTFNTIINKHADAMDNYPVPAVLPREQDDEQSAKILSEVLPVIMENTDFLGVYSEAWWDKLKHGTSAYGIFWNSTKENGIGDVEISNIDLLNIFWEPGITDIQKSRNLFITQLVDNDILKEQYPDIKDLEGDVIDVAKYVYDDDIDTSDKTVVVDWYYKKDGLVQYCKFAGRNVLYATENEYVDGQRGLYDHGLYPVVFDVLYPEKGTPYGFGFVAIDKNPQLYIDSLSSNILESSSQATKRRWFIYDGTSVNEQEFSDWTKPFVHVSNLDEKHIQEIQVSPLNGIYVDVMNQKIEEMKETSGNRDMNSGGSSSGVTAAAAIAALQEAGNKTSRDMINGAYRAYTAIIYMVVELIRQFYDEERSFRIVGEQGRNEFVMLSNQLIGDQEVGTDGENILYRRPIFDYKLKAMKRNPFSRMEENERAKELYAMGFFNPERAQEALIALDMMDFEGIETIKEKVAQGQTLLNLLEQQMQLNQTLAMAAGLGVGPQAGPQGEPTGGSQPQEVPKSKGITDSVMASQVPQQSYAQNLVNRTKVQV